MNVGIILSFLNQRYFRDSLSTYCEFIPQMIFLNGLFGYLCLLIVGKWISGSTADLYHVMIYMFLSPGSGGLMCGDGQGNYGCAENRMFPGQGPLQVKFWDCQVVWGFWGLGFGGWCCGWLCPACCVVCGGGHCTPVCHPCSLHMMVWCWGLLGRSSRRWRSRLQHKGRGW